MSKEYAESRIREALKKHKGNNTLARQQVMAWAYEDHKLLTELTQIHLKGITAYWVDRVKSKNHTPKEVPEAPIVQKVSKKHSFGEEMLRSFATQKNQTFGLEESVSNIGRRQASQKHIDAINLIASKGKEKTSGRNE